MSPETAPATVRDARPADLPGLLALEAQFPGDRLSARQFRRHLASASARLRVVDGDASLAGYALVFRRRGSRIARLYSIAVDPLARGRGTGSLLLADVEALARADGASALRLEVRLDNQAAIALYRARHYREFARLHGYYDDGIDALRFEKRMAETAG